MDLHDMFMYYCQDDAKTPPVNEDDVDATEGEDDDPDDDSEDEGDEPDSELSE